jgi:hypothetical protein
MRGPVLSFTIKAEPVPVSLTDQGAGKQRGIIPAATTTARTSQQ